MTSATHTPTSIQVALNGQPHALPPGSTLADLLSAAGLATDSVATAVNGRFVPRGQRADMALKDGDSITGFQPIVGG
jgi:sulfur carrier protein